MQGLTTPDGQGTRHRACWHTLGSLQVEKYRVVAPQPTEGCGRCREDPWLSPSLRWGYGWARGAAKGMEELGSLKLCGFPCSAGAGKAAKNHRIV